MTMQIYEFDGATICVRRKDSARIIRKTNVVEVVEDHEGCTGQKWLLLKRRNIAVVTDEMVLSEKVDRWWQE